ncbi:MAG TPA: ferredoxin [Conexibacter sp.]|nr:ferredoxin [Conexibacter sp.]
MPRVTVDPEMCIGSGNCVHLAPGGFALDDEGVAEVVEPLSADPERLQLAARSCPTGAITVESTD